MKNNRDAVERRQRMILNMVKSRGEAKVQEIAETFDISLMTVRRDLQLLEEEGLLSRTHGGAISIENRYELRRQEKDEKKCRDAISEYAAGLVEEGDTLFINGSLTALGLLDYIHEKNVTVITNNCGGMDKHYDTRISLHLTGGEVKGHVMVGEYVMRNLLTQYADKTFIGCAAVSAAGEFRYDIPTEIGINEAMISHTKKAMYIMADHSKLEERENQPALYGGCAYDHCTLITDEFADPEMLEKLRLHGVNVVIVKVK